MTSTRNHLAVMAIDAMARGRRTTHSDASCCHDSSPARDAACTTVELTRSVVTLIAINNPCPSGLESSTKPASAAKANTIEMHTLAVKERLLRRGTHNRMARETKVHVQFAHIVFFNAHRIASIVVLCCVVEHTSRPSRGAVQSHLSSLSNAAAAPRCTPRRTTRASCPTQSHRRTPWDAREASTRDQIQCTCRTPRRRSARASARRGESRGRWGEGTTTMVRRIARRTNRATHAGRLQAPPPARKVRITRATRIALPRRRRVRHRVEGLIDGCA